VIYPGRLTVQLLLIAVVASCGDPFEPLLAPVPEPEEVILHDFQTGDLLDPAAFDMFDRSAVRTDQSGSWDFVFAVDPTLGPMLEARESVIGEESDAGIQLSESEFDLLIEAPDGGYTKSEPIPVTVGSVLLVRSRQTSSFSTRCRVFGKFEVMSIDGVPAAVTLRYVINPNCEQLTVVPEPEGE